MIKPASRSTLYQDVLKQMVNAIKQGLWSPGDKIPSEMELADKFQVGRNSIREATKALAVFGIVESKPGQGTFVSLEALRKITNSELMNYLIEDSSWVELMQIRILLESQNAYWAAEKACEEDISILKQVLESSTDSEEKIHPRTEENLKYHSEFHETIARIGGNKLALRLLRSIRSEIDAQRHEYLDLKNEDWDKMMVEHRKIVNLIEQHKAIEAQNTMRKHLMYGLEKIIKKEKSSD